MRQNADKTAVDFIMIKVVILSTSLDIESLRQYRNIDRSQCQVCWKLCIDRIASWQVASTKVLYDPLIPTLCAYIFLIWQRSNQSDNDYPHKDNEIPTNPTITPQR